RSPCDRRRSRTSSEELDARLLQLTPSRLDVGDAQRKARYVRDEALAVAFGVPERERDVGRLDLAFGVLALRQPEHIAVERDGALDVARRHRHEIDLLDVH